MRAVSPPARLALLAASGLLAVVAMQQFGAGAPAAGWATIGLASIAAAVSLSATEPAFAETQRLAAVWRARRSVITGAAMCAIAVALNASAVAQIYASPYRPVMAFQWLASLALGLAGLTLLQRPEQGPAGVARTARLPAWEIAAFIGLMALAVFARVWHLDRVPPGIFIDETNAGLDALHILDGRPDSPFATGWYETPNLYIYYMAAVFRVFGATFESLKLVSILPAVLTVAALYPLARTLFGAPTAIAATGLFAIARWHLILSRWGWNELGPPLFHILGVLFLVRASRSRRWIEFALAGLMLGLCTYTYLASRLCVAAVAAYVLYRVVFERGFLRRNWAGLIVAAVAFAATFAPLATTYIRNPFTFLNRSQEVSIFKDIERAGNNAPLFESVRRHAEMFTIAGDRNARHNLPGEPMLDPVTGALFLIGVGYALWNITDHRRVLALSWIAITLLGGVLSTLQEAPQAYRTLTALPMVALLAGDTLARGGRTLRDALGALAPRLGTAARVAGVAAPVMLACAAATANLASFFGPYAANQAVYVAFTPTENAVAKEVVSQIGARDVYLSDDLYNYGPPRFLTYRSREQGGGGLARPPFSDIDLGQGLPLADRGRDAVLLLDRSLTWAESYVRRLYPGAALTPARGPRGEPLYNKVLIGSDDLQRIQGLDGAYGGVTRRDRVIDFRFPGDAPAGAAASEITWDGALRVPSSGQLTLRGEGGLRIFLDDAPFTEARFVGRGIYRLRLSLPPSQAERRVALHWRVDDGPETPVPADALFAFVPGSAGLTATYYRNETWSGAVAFSQTVPFVVIGWPVNEPWPGSFSVAFTGFISAPVSGRYTFSVDADDGARLTVNGRVLGAGLVPNQPNSFSGAIDLPAGRHPIQLEYFQRGGGKRIEFWWQPPNGPRAPVPPDALSH